MILRWSSRTDPLVVLGSALAFVLPLGGNLAAFGQSPPRPPAEVPSPSLAPPLNAPAPSAPSPPRGDADSLERRSRQLDTAHAAQRQSVDNQEKLRREIEALGNDRRALNAQLIETAAHVREVEASIEATQAKLKPLDEQEHLYRKSLDERRSTIIEILAALQRVGRRPPPALLVQPEDALRAVRTAITLGAVVPDMHAEADAIAGDLAYLMRVRKNIVDERERLSRDLALLAHAQLRLNLLVDERQKREAVAAQALDAERRRAADLAHQVDSLQDLITKLETSPDLAHRPGHEAAHGTPEETLAALDDPGRLRPAVPFVDTRGHLRFPVNGVKIRAFGDRNALGGTQRGISIAAGAGSQITSPCDGWVVYAGPFRSYGQLLILNAGGGYHVLLAGMERISVDLGQFVLTGEPVGVMGGVSQVSAAAAPGSKPPVLYVEFRKDGAPIDPSPWWATNEGEKVRG